VNDWWSIIEKEDQQNGAAGAEQSQAKPNQTKPWFLTTRPSLEYDHCSDLHAQNQLLVSFPCSTLLYVLQEGSYSITRQKKSYNQTSAPKKCSLWLYPFGPFPTNELSPD
jgi:hypothetical protein